MIACSDAKTCTWNSLQKKARDSRFTTLEKKMKRFFVSKSKSGRRNGRWGPAFGNGLFGFRCSSFFVAIIAAGAIKVCRAIRTKGVSVPAKLENAPAQHLWKGGPRPAPNDKLPNGGNERTHGHGKKNLRRGIVIEKGVRVGDNGKPRDKACRVQCVPVPLARPHESVRDNERDKAGAVLHLERRHAVRASAPWNGNGLADGVLQDAVHGGIGRQNQTEQRQVQLPVANAKGKQSKRYCGANVTRQDKPFRERGLRVRLAILARVQLKLGERHAKETKMRFPFTKKPLPWPFLCAFPSVT